MVKDNKTTSKVTKASTKLSLKATKIASPKKVNMAAAKKPEMI